MAQCNAKVSYSRKSYERNSTLYERQAVSKDTWENAKSTLDSDLASQKAAEAELVSARQDLKDCTISAPIDGIVAAIRNLDHTVSGRSGPGTFFNQHAGFPVAVRDTAQSQGKCADFSHAA